MNDKGFKVLMAIYIVAFIADIISTVINKDIIKYAEANPLFPYIGVTGIVIINIIVIFIACKIYKKTEDPSTRYFIIFAMVIIIIARIMAVQNNMIWYDHTKINMTHAIEAAKSITPEDKAATIKEHVSLNFLPSVIALLTFFFYKFDHIIKKKKER